MTRSNLRRAIAALLVAGIAVACQSKGNDLDSAKGAATTAGKDSTSAMAGMPGMSGTSASAGMMDSIETHLRTITAARPDQMKAMVPMHRQLVANMISQMNQEMRTMNMPANATWTATMDSVRQDLIHLPDMSSPDIAASIPARHSRITRLLEMHRDMMAKMK